MKIILSSYGFETPIICHKLKKTITDTNARILIIPFAGFNSKAAGIKSKKDVMEFGFHEENIFVADDNNIIELLKKSFEYIFVSGGDPFKLLSSLQNLGVLNIIKKAVADGATYIGSSAGAYIACNSIEYVKQLEDNNYICKDFKALGLCSQLIICHYDVYGYSYYRSCAEKFPKYDIIMIDNDEVIVFNGNEGMRL